MSVFADRIKLARGEKRNEINPPVQHRPNRGGVGSCHGGSVDGPCQWMKRIPTMCTAFSLRDESALYDLLAVLIVKVTLAQLSFVPVTFGTISCSRKTVKNVIINDASTLRRPFPT